MWSSEAPWVLQGIFCKYKRAMGRFRVIVILTLQTMDFLENLNFNWVKIRNFAGLKLLSLFGPTLSAFHWKFNAKCWSGNWKYEKMKFCMTTNYWHKIIFILCFVKQKVYRKSLQFNFLNRYSLTKNTLPYTSCGLQVNKVIRSHSQEVSIFESNTTLAFQLIYRSNR